MNREKMEMDKLLQVAKALEKFRKKNRER